MWLSPLESVRLNTVSLWPKQATLSSGTDPALVRSTGTLSDFADFVVNYCLKSGFQLLSSCSKDGKMGHKPPFKSYC